MGFSRMLQWMVLALMPIYLVTGCGDLEPEMQDTRTVILNMDFHGKSSSRSSSSVSASELSQYKLDHIRQYNTHLILALPSWENLTSSYKNFHSSFAQGLMNTEDNKVSLEIPLNTQMKIFAFLFEENYSMSELFSRTREVGYYGESQSFSIGSQTNNLSLGITLQSTGTDTNTGGGSTDTTPPVIAEVTAVTISTSDSTPDYTFHTTEAGSITYGGSCYSSTIIAYSGNNTITFNALSDDTYYNCTITVKDSAGNVSNTLTIPPFTVDTTVPDTTAPTVTFSPANGATVVPISNNITITFSEAVRNIDNTVLTDSNIDSLITLKLTNASGANIAFDATIDTNKKVITINPISNLFYSQAVYVAIGATVEDSAGNPITAANATFTTVPDTTAPTVTFSPVTGATGVAISDNISITFSEAVRNIDNTELTDSNIDSLFTLKLTNASGNNINFDATINSDKTVITINPTSNLPNSQAVYVAIGATVEDSAGNPITAANATFTTVQETTGPTVSSVYPADNQNEVSITENISVTFSKSMNTTSVTTNMSNTTCSGSFQLSSNNFSSCIQMSSSPSSSNSYRTFTVDPSNNLSHSTNYKIRVTTGVKDTAGNSLSSQYEISNGFTTAP